jgi:MFS family permease
MNFTSNRNLKSSIRDGINSSAALGAGESYVGAFAVYLKASALQVGILGALPPFLSALSQYLGVYLMEKVHSRRALITVLVSFQAALWIVIALLPFVFGLGDKSVLTLICVFSLYYMLAGLIAPVWSSLLGDLVPVEVRGAFFGQRSKLSGLATLISMLAAGIVLFSFQSVELINIGYLVIFLFAFLARSSASYWIASHDDPDFFVNKEDKFSFWSFLKKIPTSNFGRFSLYVSLTNFGVWFSAPYFAVYMLEVLQFNYFEFTIVTAAAILSQFITLRNWGDLSDRHGNKKLLEVCAWGIAISPLLWVVSGNVWYLVGIQLVTGVVWAGFNLSVGNFLYDAVSAPKRGRCVAYQSLLNGTAILLGSLLGGAFLSSAPEWLKLKTLSGGIATPFLLVFVISGVWRLVMALVAKKLFAEVRDVVPIKATELTFRVAHVRPESLSLRPFYWFTRKGSAPNRSRRDLLKTKLL